jgi:hypothetical protein
MAQRKTLATLLSPLAIRIPPLTRTDAGSLAAVVPPAVRVVRPAALARVVGIGLMLMVQH